MDFFVEQLIREKRGGRYFFSMFGLTVAALVLLTLGVFFGGILLPFAVVGVGYGWYWCTSMLITEYEYCVTNGDIDIDRIRGKRRKEFRRNRGFCCKFSVKTRKTRNFLEIKSVK